MGSHATHRTKSAQWRNVRIVLSVWLLFVLLLSACSDTKDVTISALSVENAWLRVPPASLDKTAGYFRLVNRSGKDLTLVGATSEQIRTIEMHTTIVDGDIMRMRRLKTIPIPAGDSIRFEPGGMHLMIFGLQTREAISISLQFDDGTTEVVPFAWKES